VPGCAGDTNPANIISERVQVTNIAAAVREQCVNVGSVEPLTGLYGSKDGAESTIPNKGVTGFDELAAWFHVN